MVEREEFLLSGKLTLKDFVKYNHYHFNWFFRIYFAVSFIVFFIIFQIPMSGNWVLIIIFAGTPSIMLSGLLYLFSRQLKKRQSIKEYKSDQRIKHTIHYTFNSDGVRQIVKKSDNHFEWEDFIELQEHKEMFLLYISKNKAIVLPKRFFQTDARIECFRDIVSQHMMETDAKN